MRHLSIIHRGHIATVDVVTKEQAEAIKRVVLDAMFPYMSTDGDVRRADTHSDDIRVACEALGLYEEYQQWLETPLPF